MPVKKKDIIEKIKIHLLDIENLKQFLMLNLRFEEWKKLEDSFEKLNKGKINQNKFIEEGLKRVGDRFASIFIEPSSKKKMIEQPISEEVEPQIEQEPTLEDIKPEDPQGIERFNNPNKIEEFIKDINDELNIIDHLFKRNSLSKEEYTSKRDLLSMKKVSLLRRLDMLE